MKTYIPTLQAAVALSVLSLSIAVSAAPVRSGNAAVDEAVPAALLAEATSLIDKGKAMSDERQLEEAGRAFGQALRLLGQLSQGHPTWKTNDVGDQMMYCDGQLERIMAELLAASPDPVAPVVDSVADPVADAPLAEEPLILPVDVDGDYGHELTTPDAGSATNPEPPAVEPEPRKGGLFAWFRRGGDDEAEAGSEPDAAATNAVVALEPVAAEPSEPITVDPAVPVAEPPPLVAPEAVTESGPAATDAFGLMTRGELKSAVLRMLDAGAPQQARDVLLAHDRAAPLSSDLSFLLGIAHCSSGDFDAAIELGKHMVMQDDGGGMAHMLLGTAYLSRGDIDIARDQMLLAIDVDPELGEAHYNMARLMVTIDPPNVRAATWHYRRARLLGEAEDPQLEQVLQQPAR